VDRTIHHRVPVPARSLTPNPDQHRRPWIIDATLIPVHESITAINKNYRRSVNTQIIISAASRGVLTAALARPGNHNNVVVARATAAHLLTANDILGDGGYRGITPLTHPGARHSWPDHPR
jgi:hypothetical protein